MDSKLDRRAFLCAMPLAVLGGTLARPSAAGAVPAPVEHPEPRPGISSVDVLPPEAVAPFGADVAAVYDMVREIPEIADGLACHCGCASFPNYRSLLTCFHRGGMAMGCQICQGEARLAHGRAREGQSLDQIRRAIDARFAR